MTTAPATNAAAPPPGRGARAAAAVLVRLAARREARAIVVLGLLAAIFGALVFLLRTTELRAWDVVITQALQRPRSPVLDRLAAAFTDAGGGVADGIVFAAALALLLQKRRPWAATLLALALLAGHPLNAVIKPLFARARPVAADLVQVILPAHGTSFPSGHAQSAALLYGFLAFLAWVLVRPAGLRTALVLVLVVLAALVGVSRVYVGAHWTSDVLGGWAVGLFALFLLAEAYRLVGARELLPRPHQPAHPFHP